MPLVAAGLIIAVVLWEVMGKSAPAAKTQSAAARGRVSATGAATQTSALSSIEKSLLNRFKPQGGAAGAKPSSGFATPSTPGGRSSATGFDQPSNQAVATTPQLTAYGTDSNGNTVWQDPSGNVYDSAGNLMNDLSGVTTFQNLGDAGPGLIVQSAPGDGSTPTPDLNIGQSGQLPGGLFDQSGGQDVALAADANAVPIPPEPDVPIDSGFEV